MKHDDKSSATRTARDNVYKNAHLRALIMTGDSSARKPLYITSNTSSDHLKGSVSPITIYITEICGKNCHLRLMRQYSIEVIKDQSSGLYDAIDEKYGIDVFASTIDEAEELIKDQLCVLWMNYGREDDKHLGPKAREMAKNLRELIQEVS